jgi:gliding motility-associated-like protein
VKVLKGNSVKLLPSFSSGKPNVYSISPALPGGLSMDPNTGIISGTLSANISGRVTYTIKGSNAFGSTEAQLTLIFNSLPTDIILSNDKLAEDNAIDDLIGVLSTVDPDSGDAHTYSLPSGLANDNQSFSIEGSSLKASQVFDFEKKKSYSITVRTTDMSGAVLDKLFTINVEDRNEAPTNISMSSSGMYENNTVGSLVANLSTEDLDLGDSHIYSLVSGDMSSFTINGNRLISNEKYVHSQKSSYSVRIRSQDRAGAYFDKDVIIMIHKAPVIMGTGNEAGSKIRTAASTNPGISKGFTSDLSVSGEDILSYQWTSSASLSALNVPNPIAKPLSNTTYQLLVSNRSGATTVVYITVEVVQDFNVTANNVITPNGDGVNDTWKIENIESYPDNELIIVDKAGRILFKQKGYANTWDGIVNGSTLTEGVYYYILKLGNGEGVKKGYINLVINQ